MKQLYKELMQFIYSLTLFLIALYVIFYGYNHMQWFPLHKKEISSNPVGGHILFMNDSQKT